MSVLQGDRAAMPASIPVTDLEILNQEIDNEQGLYRVRAASRVHYVTIWLGSNPLFDLETLCVPYLLIPKLPTFPDSDWTMMHIRRDKGNDQISHSISWDPLDSVDPLWHPRRIDIFSLNRLSSHSHRVKEVRYAGGVALAKLAIFQWWIPTTSHESEVYESLSKTSSDEVPIAPEFLGHLVEQDRCIGFLLQKIDGRHPTIDDLPNCEAALKRLHAKGWVHGDANRYNFIIERRSGNAIMVDFEHAEPYDGKLALEELQDLRTQFSETSGRGATLEIVDGEMEVAGPDPYLGEPIGV